jgi:anti-sigma factor RsiW
MTCSYLDHPSEEALERFLLHHAQEDELERVETHILSCDACVTRLEELEIQLAAAKLALREVSQERKPAAAKERRSGNNWFTFRTLSWTGAVAALAVTVTVAPRFVSRTPAAVDVSLSATRGSGAEAVPLGRALHLHLNAPDIANGPVQVVMVDANGSEIWKRAAKAQDDHVDVTVPRLDQPGGHFLRLYSVSTDHTPRDLLREFPLEVK